MFSKFLKLLSPIQWVELICIVAIALTVFSFTGKINDKVSSWFGFKTKGDLIEENTRKEAVIKEVVKANDSVVAALDTKVKSDKIDNDTVVKKFKDDIKIDNDFNKVDNKRKDDIQSVKDKFDDLPPTVENKVEKEKEISTAQINSLWDLYCTDPANYTTCKENSNV